MVAASLFVDQLYKTLLGRVPDAQGKSYWISEIDSGRLSASEVTNAFIQSHEFSGSVTPVALLYYTALGRIPDASGLQYWVSQYQAGVSLGSIGNGFVESAEFKNTYGSTISNSEFLNLLYRNVFHREPDAEGKSWWLNRMEHHGLSRAEVVIGFSSPPEQLEAQGEAVKVIVLYAGVLGSVPTQAQIDSAIQQVDYIGLISSLFQSADYMGVAVPGLAEGQSVNGVAVDGYLVNATVFADANGDGQWNEGEAKAITDSKGNFSLSVAKGTLIVSGGTDLSTGKAFESVLKAPQGSKVVTPLTTLQEAFVAQGLSTSEAQAAVAKALDLNVGQLDLTTFDPIAQALNNSNNAATQAIALELQVANAKLQSVIDMAASVLIGAAGGEAKLSAASAVQSIVGAIVSQTNNTTIIDLGSASVLQEILTDSVALSGDADLKAATQKVTALAADFSNTASQIVSKIDTAASSGVSGSEVLVEIAKIQGVVQGELGSDLSTAAQTGNLADIGTKYSGDSLTELVTATKVIDIDPNSTTDDAAVTEGNTQTETGTGGGTTGGGTGGGTSSGGSGGGSTGGGGGGVTPTPSSQSVWADQYGGTTGSPATFNASTAVNTIYDDALVANVIHVSGFTADDSLSLTQSPSGHTAFSSTGTDVLITTNLNGVVSLIKLLNVLSQDTLVYDLASFNALSIGNLSYSNLEYQQTRTLDSLGGSLASPASFNVANGSFSLADNALTASAVNIIGFGANDNITFSNALATELSVSSRGSDVLLTINHAGTVSTLTLVGVVSSNDIVYDLTSFNALPVGNLII